jgi:hypothetical protein
MQPVSSNRLHRAWQNWMIQQDAPANDIPDPASSTRSV